MSTMRPMHRQCKDKGSFYGPPNEAWNKRQTCRGNDQDQGEQKKNILIKVSLQGKGVGGLFALRHEICLFHPTKAGHILWILPSLKEPPTEPTPNGFRSDLDPLTEKTWAGYRNESFAGRQLASGANCTSSCMSSARWAEILIPYHNLVASHDHSSFVKSAVSHHELPAAVRKGQGQTVLWKRPFLDEGYQKEAGVKERASKYMLRSWPPPSGFSANRWPSFLAKFLWEVCQCLLLLDPISRSPHSFVFGLVKWKEYWRTRYNLATNFVNISQECWRGGILFWGLEVTC